jgi:hypothetical protein
MDLRPKQTLKQRIASLIKTARRRYTEAVGGPGQAYWRTLVQESHQYRDPGQEQEAIACYVKVLEAAYHDKRWGTPAAIFNCTPYEVERANTLLQQIIGACALPDAITADAALQRRFLGRALVQWANDWYGKVNARKIDLFQSAAATLYQQALSISETLGRTRDVWWSEASRSPRSSVTQSGRAKHAGSVPRSLPDRVQLPKLVPCVKKHSALRNRPTR